LIVLLPLQVLPRSLHHQKKASSSMSSPLFSTLQRTITAIPSLSAMAATIVVTANAQFQALHVILKEIGIFELWEWYQIQCTYFQYYCS
jgi:hypothetical protein